MKIDNLLDDYRKDASKHGACTEDGDNKNGNKAYKNLQKTFEKIKEIGEEVKLLVLFNDDNKWVQLWAASHSLAFDEKKAIKKLEQLKNENLPHISTNAKYTIMEWKENN